MFLLLLLLFPPPPLISRKHVESIQLGQFFLGPLHCLTCSTLNNHLCMACEDGFLLTSTYECVLSSTTISCDLSFSLMRTPSADSPPLCVPCVDPNCFKCDLNLSICTICRFNFHLSPSGQCMLAFLAPSCPQGQFASSMATASSAVVCQKCRKPDHYKLICQMIFSCRSRR